jgi:hypothetical protein
MALHRTDIFHNRSAAIGTLHFAQNDKSIFLATPRGGRRSDEARIGECRSE